jgi:hypothetical protein
MSNLTQSQPEDIKKIIDLLQQYDGEIVLIRPTGGTICWYYNEGSMIVTIKRGHRSHVKKLYEGPDLGAAIMAMIGGLAL